LLLEGLTRAEVEADAEAVALELEGLAAAASADAEPERAAILLGAADSVRAEAWVPRDLYKADETAQMTATTAAVSAAIGPETLALAAGRGRALPRADALAVARRAMVP
jgi:hypothetical protein